jgi:hypothetical protein
MTIAKRGHMNTALAEYRPSIGYRSNACVMYPNIDNTASPEESNISTDNPPAIYTACPLARKSIHALNEVTG